MRIPLLFAVTVLLISLAVDLYISRRLKGHNILQRVHAAIAASFTILWIAIICVPKRIGDDGFMMHIMWALYAYWSVYVPKYIAVIFDLAGAIPRMWHKARVKLFSYVGAAIGFLIFGAIWWGALAGRFHLDINKVNISIPDLPAGMRGLRIVQISDWHVGSYGTDTAFVSRAIDSINALRPDLIVFTGDIVNRHSNELRPFEQTMSRLHAPLGVYSVMGNHDYGDYYAWASEYAHLADADTLRAIQRRMGWHMLDNETVMLHRGSDSLALVGVENIGEPPFKTRGNLLRAYPTPADSTAKILLSHNPMHWTDSIAGKTDRNFALTLSGHTHAMQMQIGGWSPAEWRYPKWKGLHSDSLGRQLYVNIGLGTVGMPMRIGASPEITLITLN